MFQHSFAGFLLLYPPPKIFKLSYVNHFRSVQTMSLLFQCIFCNPNSNPKFFIYSKYIQITFSCLLRTNIRTLTGVNLGIIINMIYCSILRQKCRNTSQHVPKQQTHFMHVPTYLQVLTLSFTMFHCFFTLPFWLYNF